jgi:hypothetical protein
MSAKPVTYTPEQTLELVELYKAGQSTDELALAFGKSVRSIVAKLAREGVYQKKEKAAKALGSTRKDEVVLTLELAAGVEMPSLHKCTKEDLEKLLAFIKREG